MRKVWIQHLAVIWDLLLTRFFLLLFFSCFSLFNVITSVMFAFVDQMLCVCMCVCVSAGQEDVLVQSRAALCAGPDALRGGGGLGGDAVWGRAGGCAAVCLRRQRLLFQ